MLQTTYEPEQDLIRTIVDGKTPNSSLIHWLSDLSVNYQDKDQLFVLLDLRSAIIEMDLRYYSFDMADAMEVFISKLGSFSKVAIANVIAEDDQTNKVLIEQFSKLRKQLPTYYTEIFHDSDSAEKWLRQQQST